MPKTVLVLEDEDLIRKGLQIGLEARGMNVLAAGSEDEAWTLLRRASDLDVVVLDIMLGRDTQGSGFEFASRLKKEEKDPEFLIHSAYDDVDYFQAALTLGAAAYIRKGDVTNDEVPRVEILAEHIRALAVRRALRRPRMAGALQGMAAVSRSKDEVVERFCRDILAPELEAVVGQNFLLLFKNGDQTIAFGHSSVFPPAALEHLERAIHSRLGDATPFVVSVAAVSAEHEDVRHAFGVIEGSAFLPLGETHFTRLTLGVLPGEHGANAAAQQMSLFDRYVQPVVQQILIEIADVFSAVELEREREQRQTLLRATTDFCLSQSQLLASLIWEAEKEAGDQEWPSLMNLRMVADEMRDAGELLVHFGTSSGGGADPTTVDMPSLVERIWKREVFARLRVRAPHAMRLEGRCVARERADRVERTVSQIMSWLGRRFARPGGRDRDPRRDSEPLPEIAVRCTDMVGRDRVQIVFEEHLSPRLSPAARATLFDPFNPETVEQFSAHPALQGRRLGLYLARTLAELGGGSLTERSDELRGESGHRFVLELLAAERRAEQ